MKKILLSMLAVIVLLSVVGCAQVPSTGVALSEKQRDISPDVSTSDSTKLVEGNSEFAFDLYQALRQQKGNLFYSPYSISLALAMTYAGARGGTEQQMADTLHFELQQALLHPAFNALDLELASRGEAAKEKDDQGFRLHIVNTIWGQNDYKYLNGFLDVLAVNYGAGLRLLDFISEPEQSRITINNWVSDQTEGKIKDLIPQRMIGTGTRLVLTNAIYFNAAWWSPFEKESTRDEVFYLLEGGNVTVPMMTQTQRLKYAEGDLYQAVELPYDGDELSMIILLPASGQFESFENSLDAALADQIISHLAYDKVELTMPRFEFESDFRLADILIAMGMPAAFSSQADFSGITGNHELRIGEVLHKAFVSVDESGTEATAATAVLIEAGWAPGQPEQQTMIMRVHRPFIFLIRDIQTGTILFVGRVMNPVT